ncbi:T9SS type A sorting domain-containing protein [Bacteroides sp.]|uniref:T9SS type A sorting domain-containing protein n=1 Tax=Bacteroides sp. TaxID=29523 RepID=UPI0025BE0687|nr:T9SS type A sorting domain-containing protein [Bacteroides sp.]
MKKYLLLAFFAWANAGVFTMQVSAFSGNGSGNAESPYLITTAVELDEVRDNLTAHYKLMNNIDLTDWITKNSPVKGWEPINGFKGSLDGNGFVISGFWIERPETENIGLFGSLSGGTIKRIGLVIPDDKKITGLKNVGTLVGHTPYSTTGIVIEECFVKGGAVEAKNSAAGGIMGYTSTTSVVTIRNCYVANKMIIGADGAGGLIGTAYRDVTMENCYCTSTVKSTNNDKSAGGLVGGTNDTGKSYTVKNSVALNPDIISAKSAGRIIGWVKNSSKTSFSGNLAFDEMLVDGKVITDGMENNNDGLGKSKKELNEESTYMDLGWNFDVTDGVWTMGNGKYSLPVLKNVSVEQQPTVTPEHLYIEGTTNVITEKESSLLIYPHVTEGKIIITNKASTSMVTIYDLTGSIMLQSDMSVLDISSFTNGVYLVKIENEIVKIIKR